jgi:hypothetical protein
MRYPVRRASRRGPAGLPMKRNLTVYRAFAAAALAAAVIFGADRFAIGQDGPPISKTQLQKILKTVDSVGAKGEFPGPTAENLGLSDKPFQALPLISVITSDHLVYFCRSQLNPGDYVIWALKGKTSYLFSTRDDLKLIAAVHLNENNLQEVRDIKSAEVQSAYKDALRALAKDVGGSPQP